MWTHVSIFLLPFEIQVPISIPIHIQAKKVSKIATGNTTHLLLSFALTFLLRPPLLLLVMWRMPYVIVRMGLYEWLQAYMYISGLVFRRFLSLVDWRVGNYNAASWNQWNFLLSIFVLLHTRSLGGVQLLYVWMNSTFAPCIFSTYIKT